jgi:hypothetical protein
LEDQKNRFVCTGFNHRSRAKRTVSNIASFNKSRTTSLKQEEEEEETFSCCVLIENEQIKSKKTHN